MTEEFVIVAIEVRTESGDLVFRGAPRIPATVAYSTRPNLWIEPLLGCYEELLPLSGVAAALKHALDNTCWKEDLPGGDLAFPRREESAAEWIIQRCAQRWIGTELQYEDFATSEGRMTRDVMLTVLERVMREHPDDEFRGHKLETAVTK